MKHCTINDRTLCVHAVGAGHAAAHSTVLYYLASVTRSEGFEFDREEFWDFIRAGREQFLGPHPQVPTLRRHHPSHRPNLQKAIPWHLRSGI